MARTMPLNKRKCHFVVSLNAQSHLFTHDAVCVDGGGWFDTGQPFLFFFLSPILENIGWSFFLYISTSVPFFP
jgi:hypothetical protein